MRVVRLFIALAALLLFIPCLWSQTVVTGKVTNTKGEALPITGISVNQGESGTITGEDGRFVLKLAKKKRYLLEVQRLGYVKYEKNFVLENQDTLVLNVTLINSELSEVVVSDRQGASTMKSIDSRFAAGVPSPSGDFLNALLSSQPGVSMRNELSSSYSVRGGSFDENIVYVNDIEVYRPFLVRSGQQEGLSFINGDMVDRVSFSAGGFEAKYGDKLSSVLDVKYRQPKKFAGSAQLGIMMGSLHLENASKSGKTTYLVGFRYRNNGYILRSLDTQGEYTPRYLDLQSYLTHQFSKRWSLGFLGNYSSNRFQFIPQTRQTELGSIQQALRFTVFFDGQEITRYRTGLGALDLQYKVNDDWRIKLIGSHYETRENEEFDIVGQYRLDEVERDFSSDNFGNVTRNLGVGGYLNHARNELQGTVSSIQIKSYQSYLNHYFQYGAGVQQERFDDRLREYTYLDSADYSVPLNSGNTLAVSERIKGNNILNTLRYSAYVQDNYVYLNDNDDEWNINAGARLQYWDFNRQWLFSPRATVSFRPSWERQINDSTRVKKDVNFRLSGGVYYQSPFYREMRDPFGVINKDIRAQKSIHLVLGSDYGLRIWNRPFKLVSELYYKTYSSLIPYELENVRLRYYARNNAVGFARGADFKLNGEFVQGIESWASLSFLSTKEDLVDDQFTRFFNQQGQVIDAGVRDQVAVDSAVVRPGFIPRPTDQLISFGLFFQDQMLRFKDYKVNINLVFATGLPFGPPSFDRFGDTLRTPSYRRVDIGFLREIVNDNKPGKGLLKHAKQAFLSVEVFNLLQISNTINYQWIEGTNGAQYAVPNYLTARRVNVKFVVRF